MHNAVMVIPFLFKRRTMFQIDGQRFGFLSNVTLSRNHFPFRKTRHANTKFRDQTTIESGFSMMRLNAASNSAPAPSTAR